MLEKLWINLEEQAERASNFQILIGAPENKQADRGITPDEEFNNRVSKIFMDFVSEMLASDVQTWLEAKLRDSSTTMRNCYFDADKISPILWTSFSSAADFLLNNFVSKVTAEMAVQPVRYKKETSLKGILDDIRRRHASS